MQRCQIFVSISLLRCSKGAETEEGGISKNYRRDGQPWVFLPPMDCKPDSNLHIWLGFSEIEAVVCFCPTKTKWRSSQRISQEKCAEIPVLFEEAQFLAGSPGILIFFAAFLRALRLVEIYAMLLPAFSSIFGSAGSLGNI
jgi:hypothetical protein